MKKSYKSGDYEVSDIYQGGYSSLNPLFNVYTAAGTLGMTTDPRVANILQEVSSKLSTGAKQISVTAVSPEIFDSIPKQQLKEVHRLSKLTGIDVSMHGPVMDVAGISQQGYSEVDRESAERKVTDVLLRSKELNPEGNIPVTFHTAEGIPGSQFLPPAQRKEGEEYKRLIIVNRETGRLAPLEAEKKFYPQMEELKPGVQEKIERGIITKEDLAENRGKYIKQIPLEEGKYYSPEKRVEVLNATEWDNSLNQVFFNQERAQEILGKNQAQIQHLQKSINDMKERKISDKEIREKLTPTQRHAWSNLQAAQNYLQDVHQQVNGLFSKAYEFGTDEQKNHLKKLSEDFRTMIEKNGADPLAQAEAMNYMVNELKKEEYAPSLYEPIEKFATEKTAQTFGNAAFNSYKKFKGKSPVLVIENPPAGFGLSTGEDVKRVVEESREQFIENAKKEGMSESQARKEAEKLIGATWDVGHINMLRKYGYSEEDIIKETEKVAPYVKQIHLSDNFGFEHTELPMGMGNVPLKEMMAKLGQKGFEAPKIIEAANWWQHFKTAPFQETLEATGSPLYSMKMSPDWSQAPGLYQGYSSGMEGQWLPQIHYETFGTGFSRLPKELGGQAGGQGGRMSGRPME